MPRWPVVEADRVDGLLAGHAAHATSAGGADEAECRVERGAAQHEARRSRRSNVWTWRRRADEHLRNLPIDGVGRGLPRVSGNPKRHGQLPPAPGFLSLRRQLHDDARRVRRHRQVDDVDDALFARPRGLGRGVVRRQVAHLTARGVEERFPFRRATRTLRGGVVAAQRGESRVGSGGAQQALESALGVRLPERGPDVFADAIVGGKGTGAAHGEQIGLGVQLDDERRDITDERSQPGRAGAGDEDVP